MQAALQQAWELQRRLDIVVATVGGGGFRPLLMHDAASLMAELELNIASAFLAVRHASPLMAPHGGAIVCISSNAARMTCRWLSAYCAAKAGLEAFVRAAAEELAGCGIRVNAVRPGLTRSGATGPMFDNPAMLDKFVAQMPLGRAGEPDDIASAVRYLAGPESGWVTGQSIAVDGGSELRAIPSSMKPWRRCMAKPRCRPCWPAGFPKPAEAGNPRRETMHQVKDKVALVTGAASGVGRADALLLRAGARVVISDVNQEAGQALAREIGDAAMFVRHDIASEEDWRKAMAATQDRFGRLDVLVNNAAICPLGSIEETSLDSWRQVMRVNADGYFLGCRFGVQAMKATPPGAPSW